MIHNRFNWLHYHKHWLIEPLHHKPFLQIGVSDDCTRMIIRIFGLDFMLDGRDIDVHRSPKSTQVSPSSLLEAALTVVELKGLISDDVVSFLRKYVS